MKVYQIHEYSGSYDDFADYIVGTFLSEAKAKEHMEHLQSIIADMVVKYNRCAECDFSKSCFVDDGAGYCENCYDYRYEMDDAYEIKEVEVIE